MTDEGIMSYNKEKTGKNSIDNLSPLYRRGQYMVSETGKNSIDNLSPLYRLVLFFSLCVIWRKSERDRGCAEGCGNVVNLKGFPSFPCPGAGGKGEVTFSLSTRRVRSFALPFPLSPPPRIFFLVLFLWRWYVCRRIIAIVMSI